MEQYKFQSLFIQSSGTQTMKKKIYIHVGYPKTATTTMQKHYFPNFKTVNYVGLNYEKDQYSLYPEAFKLLILADEDLIKQNSDVSTKIYDALDNTPVFLSDEKIIGSLFTPRITQYRFTERPSAHASARAIRALLPSTLFDVKIIFTIRQQWDSIPSKYAQSFTAVYSKSPKLDTFEKFVNDILRNKDSFIRHTYNYEKVIGIYESVFEKENIKIMPFEAFRINPSSFINELLLFFNTNEVYHDAENPIPKENVRATFTGEHRHSNYTLFDLSLKLRDTFASNIKTPRFINPNMLRRIKLPYIKQPGRIKLDSTQRDDLINLYSSSNKTLSDKHGLNLNKYGYF